MVIGCLKNIVLVWMIKYPKETRIQVHEFVFIQLMCVNFILELIFKCQKQF